MGVGPAATPDTATSVVRPLVVEKPVNAKLAGKALGELRDRAQKLGSGLTGWYEIRTGKVDDWLRDADPSKKQSAGFLRQENPDKGVTKWEDNTATRDYLENAQRRALELAQKGIGEISADLGVPTDQIASKNLEEIYDAAEAKGWNVTEGNPKGDETRDYLRNAHEYAREQHDNAEYGVEVEEQIAETQVLVEAGSIAVEIDPRLARPVLGLIREGGEITGGVREEINKLIASKEPEKVALGLDLEIAGLEHQLVLKSEAIRKAAEKGNNKQIAKLSLEVRELKVRIAEVQNQRTTGKVEIDGTEVEIQNLNSQPNHVDAFIKKIGIEAKKVNVTYLNEQGEAEVLEVTSFLASLHDTLSLAIKDKDARTTFVENLRKNSGLPEESIKQIEKYLGSGVFHKRVEKGRNIAIKTGATVGVLMLLMAWLASKEKQGMAMG